MANDPRTGSPLVHAPRSHIHVEASTGWTALNLGELWRYRDLLYFLTWRDIKVHYKQTLLGAAWAVLPPIMTMVVFSFFFGNLANLPSEGLPYPIYIYSGMLPWQLFTYALNASGNSLVNNRGLITKVYFPRLIVPFSAVLAGLVDFGISFIVLLVLMAYYGITPTLAVVFLPLMVLLALATALAAGLWLSALNARYRDIRYILPFLTQFWFFLTPVAYSTSVLPAWLQPLVLLNPMTGVVTGFRWALLGIGEVAGGGVILAALMVVVVFWAGLAYFRRMERDFVDRL